jgi:hypothetical protein
VGEAGHILPDVLTSPTPPFSDLPQPFSIEVDMARGKKRGGKKASISTTFTPAFGRGKGRGKKRR